MTVWNAKGSKDIKPQRQKDICNKSLTCNDLFQLFDKLKNVILT